jgi:hemoglobin-like flavoprotein
MGHEDPGQKMINMITTIVNDLEGLVPAVQELGRRHSGYGVQEKHYGSVALAPLWTLEQGLGKAFTLEVKSAWIETYMVLAGVMKDASAKATKAA